MRVECLTACFVLGIVAPASAATHPAASCDRADVQAAVDVAADGDTVVIPSCPAGVTWADGTLAEGLGPCSMTEWSCAAVQIPATKGLWIQGQGVGETVINASTIGVMFWIETTEATPFHRLTGIEFTYVDGGSDQGAIVVRGTAKDWRLDHLKFGSAATPFDYRAFNIGSAYDCTRGLIDHVEVHNLGGDGSYLAGACYGGEFGDGSFSTPAHWGLADALFVEDSEFHHYTNMGRGAGIDSWGGARYVFRHNGVWDEVLAVHGAGSGGRGRGYRTMEIYQNDFFVEGQAVSTIVSVRGGTARIHDNRIEVTETAEVWANSFAQAWVETWDQDRGPPYGNCTDATFEGLCSEDGVTACAADGECTGTCDAVHDPPGSMGGDGDGAGYPCRDHVGRGLDTGVTTPQALEPVYNWGNSGDFTTIVNNDGSSTEDVDFFNCASKADCVANGMVDYEDYPYPHPLQVDATQTCAEQSGVCCDEGDSCSSNAYVNSTDCGASCCLEGTCGPACADADDDTFADIACGGNDCDDSDAAINPGASEVCGNGVDEDCDGTDDCVDTGGTDSAGTDSAGTDSGGTDSGSADAGSSDSSGCGCTTRNRAATPWFLLTLLLYGARRGRTG